MEVVLLAGAACTSITPDLRSRSYWLAGFERGRAALEVHDELSARALVMQSGDWRRVALATVDLIGLPQSRIERLRNHPRVRSLGLDQLCIVATHTHAAPDSLGLWGPEVDRSGVDPEYLASVEERLIEVLERACRDLQPVVARTATTRTPGWIQAAHPEDTVEDRLHVLQLRREAVGTLATVVSWSPHPDVLGADNQAVSADYPGALRAAMEASHGGTCLFVPGALGGGMSGCKLALPGRGFQRCENLGEQLGRQASQALRDSLPLHAAPMELRRQKFRVPLDNALLQAGLQSGTLEPRTLSFSAGAAWIHSECSMWSLGELSWLLLPGEIDPALLVATAGEHWPYRPLREALEPAQAWVLGLANDELGYIVPPWRWSTAKDPVAPRPAQEMHSVGGELAARLFAALECMVPALRAAPVGV
jgi:hypothetical protein